MQKQPTTQRAYTLRLREADPNDRSWTDALWQTHEAVNNGAKVFGDWLLTLRGGLDHTLADAKIKGGKGKPDRDPTVEERKARRILLALSWLSVESKLGAPAQFIIASGQDVVDERNRRVVAAFGEILNARGIGQTEMDDWKIDCVASLSAAIRDDAVWVNRSAAFDEAAKSIGSSFTREEAWDMLGRFFGGHDVYLSPAPPSEEESLVTEQSEKAKDLVQKAGQWLSSRFGTGKGADFIRMAKVYGKIAAWADNAQAGMTGNETINNLATVLSAFTPVSNDLQGVLGLISGPGYKSATRNFLEKIAVQDTVTQQDLASLKDSATQNLQNCEQNIGAKGQRAYSNAILDNVESVCGFTYRVDQDGCSVSVEDYSKYGNDYSWGSARHSEFAVMLDHAARRVSLAHTWIKRAEAERGKFEEDAKKSAHIFKAAKDWLDKFCLERSDASGALEPYRIRRRAIDGWKEVFGAWTKPDCNTTEDRITAVRALQCDPEIDKFGDIRLFEALAEDDAICVWHVAEAPDPQPLIDYTLATEADFKKRQFKVPAYRHPDALLHPIFCDFGNSRWNIDFSIRKAASGLDNAKARVASTEEAVAKAKTAWDKDPESAKLKVCLQQKQKNLTEAQQELAWLSSIRGLYMTLWNGNAIVKTALCWQSKRLVHDLALGRNTQKVKAPEVVTRADRLGRAASNVSKYEEVEIAELFKQEYWNGRLQAPRQRLEAIAKRVERCGWDEKAQKMKNNLQWLVTFSAKLEQKGPWLDYEKVFMDSSPSRPFVSAKGDYAVRHLGNDKRKSQAKLILSRLPGLRVLSVDLGHRHAAACAVWEALSAEQVKEACRAVGLAEPNESDLYLHLKKKVKKQKKNKEVEVEETTVYRRIGADTLPDGLQHPAPWARLDRQFLIKLQGEEDGAREASNEEVWKVHQLEAELGRTTSIIDRLVKVGWGQTGQQEARLEILRELGWKPATPTQDSGDSDEGAALNPSLSVDELRLSAVRTLRLALKRHGDRARIAFAMTAEYKLMPGNRKYYFAEAKEFSANDDLSTRVNTHIEFIQDALMLWHDLTSSRGWRDDMAKQLWNDHITSLPGYKSMEEIGEDASGVDRKKKQKKNRETLHDVAEALLEDERLREALGDAWKNRWKNDDERWKKQLRWFKDWVLPRGTHANDPTIRKTGGLSLTRLATQTEFSRKVQIGFFTRLHPDGTRAAAGEQFGQNALDAIEHLREQRVKQLASRIVEAALGIGSEGGKGWNGGKRPVQRIDDPRFAPCQAIVIENLTHYRPEETRTRRENRQLMSWASSKVKQHLAEACQLHGLHLREVSAGYTSRQDSRTGAPGIRCQDVPIKEFMRSPFWQKQVAQAQKKQAEGKGGAREQLLCTLNELYKYRPAGTVRVPIEGGEIFVSADPASSAAKGLQADLNAAANIGLRALIDPDWPGKWWYVPCDPGSFRPVKDKVDGSAAVKPEVALRQAPQAQNGAFATNIKKRGKNGADKSREVINLWRDISSSRLEDASAEAWQERSAYWNTVQSRVIRILDEQAQHRAMQLRAGAMEDDVPF